MKFLEGWASAKELMIGECFGGDVRLTIRIHDFRIF